MIAQKKIFGRLSTNFMELELSKKFSMHPIRINQIQQEGIQSEIETKSPSKNQ